jgi:hypothetical protein
MTMNRRISRRTLLKGFGTAIALPWLEAMLPPLALGATAPRNAPRRLAFFYVPNGVHMAAWTPEAEGKKFELPFTLEPLKPFRDDLLVLSGLTCDKARPHGDGPGDHARAMSAFLTGCQARKTHGADIKVGASADQVAAQKIGQHTKFASLELGTDRGMNSGNCDSGYSCAYSANLSWRTESLPMAKEVNPRLVFERLFATEIQTEGKEARGRRDRYKLSILDFVAEDAQRLKQRLGATDQRKLEEYLTGIREIEQRLVRASLPVGKLPDNIATPTGVPQDYEEHIRLLCDMLVLAFQGDLTRVCTFILANEGSNRPYRFIGIPEGHHDLSHHGGNKEKQSKISRINRFHMEQFAYLLGKLKSVREGDGTVLDNCMLAYGSGNSDGNRHNHDDLPVVMAGRGGGSVQTGRHLRYPPETPLTNLWLAMLDRVGAPAEKLGDSTGKLESLS